MFATRLATCKINTPKSLKFQQTTFKPKSSFRKYADIVSDKVSLTFASPFTAVFLKEPVDLVTVPSIEGEMGIAPSHVPIVAELSPGVVSVSRAGKVDKYFISSGFIKVDSLSNASISCVEVVPVADLDKAAAQRGIDLQTKLLAAAKTEDKRAQHQISIDVYQTIIRAIESGN